VKRSGGLKEAEAYQSVPSARALVLADFIAHLFYFLEAAKLQKWCRRSVYGVQRWYGHFFAFFSFLPFPFGVLCCVFRNMYGRSSFFLTCAFVLPNEYSTRFVAI